MRSVKLLLIALLIMLLTGLSVSAEVIFDWNESGNGGTTWQGWNYSTDVKDDGGGFLGFYIDGAQKYAHCTRVTRIAEKTGYGQDNDFRIDTTKIAPSTSSGAALKVYDDGTGDVNQVSFWLYWDRNLGNQGLADVNTNRMDYYIYLDGLADPDYADPHNYNFHGGAYLASDGSECYDGGDAEGPGNRKYYHNIVYKPGAWIHTALSDHPERIRGDTVSMALHIPNYFRDLNSIYFEIRQAQTNPTTVWFDELKVSEVVQNNISVDGLWVGYWPSTDTWNIGWQDPYTIEQYGGGAESTYQVRYSTSPITNANWDSATVVQVEVNAYNTDYVRRANNWNRTFLTYFHLPDSVEENDVIYFAVKDVSSISENGDAHDNDEVTGMTNVTPIDYALLPRVEVLPARNLKLR